MKLDLHVALFGGKLNFKKYLKQKLFLGKANLNKLTDCNFPKNGIFDIFVFWGKIPSFENLLQLLL